MWEMSGKAKNISREISFLKRRNDFPGNKVKKILTQKQENIQQGKTKDCEKTINFLKKPEWKADKMVDEIEKDKCKREIDRK